MADEPIKKAGAPDAQQVLEDEGLEENPMDALNAAAEEDEATGGEPEVKPAASAADSALQARLDKLEEENIAQRQQLDVQRGQLSVLASQREKPTETAKAPEPKRVKMPTREEIRAALSAEGDGKALENLTGMFVDLSDQMNAALDDVRNNASQNFRARDSRERFLRTASADRSRAIKRFSEELIQDPEFVEEADAASNALEKERGSGDYIAGDFYNLALQIYDNWRENGKLDAWKAKRNGGNERPSLKEVRRMQGNSSDVVERGGSSGKGDTSTLSDLYNGDAREIRIARMNMKRMGISEKDWIASMSAAKREDPSFGN